MAKEIYVNLPVIDLNRSIAFYSALGFSRDERFSNDEAAAMIWSDSVAIMLLTHDFYRGFLPHKAIADAHRVSELMLALAFDSRAEVDAFAQAAAAHGGRVDVRPVQDLGFMYSRAVEDPDGHIFEPMFMDMAAAGAAYAGAD